MVAARIANLERGGDRRSDQTITRPFENTTQKQSATSLNVGIATVVRAKRVLRLGAPNIVEMVEKGMISVNEAVRVVRSHPMESQERMTVGGAKAAAAEIRMANEVDAGQARGEIATPERGGANVGAQSSGTVPSTLTELGITSQRLADWRRVRDAGEAAKAKAWDLWLDCLSEREIAEHIGVPQQTISGWLTEKRNDPDFGNAPESRQHFDVWSFTKGAD